MSVMSPNSPMPPSLQSPMMMIAVPSQTPSLPTGAALERGAWMGNEPKPGKKGENSVFYVGNQQLSQTRGLLRGRKRASFDGCGNMRPRGASRVSGAILFNFAAEGECSKSKRTSTGIQQGQGGGVGEYIDDHAAGKPGSNNATEDGDDGESTMGDDSNNEDEDDCKTSIERGNADKASAAATADCSLSADVACSDHEKSCAPSAMPAAAPEESVEVVSSLPSTGLRIVQTPPMHDDMPSPQRSHSEPASGRRKSKTSGAIAVDHCAKNKWTNQQKQGNSSTRADGASGGGGPWRVADNRGNDQNKGEQGAEQGGNEPNLPMKVTPPSPLEGSHKEDNRKRGMISNSGGSRNGADTKVKRHEGKEIAGKAQPTTSDGEDEKEVQDLVDELHHHHHHATSSHNANAAAGGSTGKKGRLSLVLPTTTPSISEFWRKRRVCSAVKEDPDNERSMCSCSSHFGDRSYRSRHHQSYRSGRFRTAAQDSSSQLLRKVGEADSEGEAALPPLTCSPPAPRAARPSKVGGRSSRMIQIIRHPRALLQPP